MEKNDDLERLFAGLDFQTFIGQKMSPFIIDFDPSDNLDHPLWMLVRLVMTCQLGEYSSDPFRDWLDVALKVGGVTSFSDIGKGDPEHQLKVVVSNISRGQMLVLPGSPPDPERSGFPVAEAVRLSMSIPFFFAPGRLDGDYIVDGGILSNYPIWIYDQRHPDMMPRWPTFGFRLDDSREDAQPIPIHNAPDILKAMFKTMMYAHDRHYMDISKPPGRLTSILRTRASRSRSSAPPATRRTTSTAAATSARSDTSSSSGTGGRTCGRAGTR